MKKLLVSLLCLFILMPTFVFAEEIKIDDTDLTIDLDENVWYVFTRDNIKDYDYFNITYMNYDFSVNYNIARIEYNLQFFDKNDNYITPSDLALYKDIQVICMLEINNAESIIFTFPNIIDNKFFQCVEYFGIYEKISVGIKLYQNTDNMIFYTKECIYQKSTKEAFQNVDFLVKNNIEIPQIIDFTRKTRKNKRIKIDYHQDVRDIIKDIYKHI